MDDLLKIIRNNFDNLTKEFNINPNKFYKNFDNYFVDATSTGIGWTDDFNAQAVDIYNQLKEEARAASDAYTTQRREKIGRQNRRRNSRRKSFTLEDGSTVKQYYDKNGNVRAQIKNRPDGTREVRRQHTADTISKDPLAKNMSKVISTYDGHTTNVSRRPDSRHIESRVVNHDTGEVVTTHTTRANDWGGGVKSQDVNRSTIEKERTLHNQRLEQRYGGANNTQQNTRRRTLKNGDRTYRPETVMNGNSVEIDSIYNHSTPRRVNRNNTSSGSSTYDDMMNVIKNDSRIDFYEKNNVVGFSDFGDEFEHYSFEGAFDTNGNIKYLDVSHVLGESANTYDFMDPTQRQKFFDVYANNHGETAEISESLNRFSQALDEQQQVKTERYVDRQQANVERQRERARQDLERQEQEQQRREQQRQERERQEEQARQEQQAQSQQSETSQPETQQTQPETTQTNNTRRDRTNVDGPIPNTTSGPYVNNTRIDLDPETSVSTMDISDPLNIHQRIVDGNGNTRDITWRRKGRWSDQKELVSDISWNENGVFDNMTQTYTGKDVSPIEWKYAGSWSDDYIIGRAGDDEDLLNSMMNARERKIEAQRRYDEKHRQQQQSSNTAENTAQEQTTGPKQFDPNDPTTWTDKDIADMAQGDPEFYEELLQRRAEATGGSTHNQETTSETMDPPEAETTPEGPDMNDPLNWTDEYMDEMSEGDPTYYEELRKQRDAAVKAEKYKNIDPSNPSSWTDDYIKDTALNEDEFNWMNEKMRQAKNLDTVDELNRQRRTPQPEPNRQQRREQSRQGNQKGNTQKKKSKKQKKKDKKNKKFNDRHTAMGNDPDEQREINKAYNEAKKQKKQEEKQQQQAEEQRRQQEQADAEQQQRINNGDPSQWTDEDIKKMADGDPDVYEDLINQRDKARGVDTSDRTSDFNKEMGDTDAPEFGDSEIDKMIDEGLPESEVHSSVRRGKLSGIDKIMTGVNILGAIGDYKSYRRQGDNVISAGVKTAAKFAIDEALGLWAFPVAIIKNTPGAIIKGADMLYKESRRMNSAANQQTFGDAQFLDTQQLATMRQSGMEMAKMAQYNLQQTLMGSEATYLHR